MNIVVWFYLDLKLEVNFVHLFGSVAIGYKFESKCALQIYQIFMSLKGFPENYKTLNSNNSFMIIDHQKKTIPNLF